MWVAAAQWKHSLREGSLRYTAPASCRHVGANRRPTCSAVGSWCGAASPGWPWISSEKVCCQERWEGSSRAQHQQSVRSLVQQGHGGGALPAIFWPQVCSREGVLSVRRQHMAGGREHNVEPCIVRVAGRGSPRSRAPLQRARPPMAGALLYPSLLLPLGPPGGRRRAPSGWQSESRAAPHGQPPHRVRRRHAPPAAPWQEGATGRAGGMAGGDKSKRWRERRQNTGAKLAGGSWRRRRQRAPPLGPSSLRIAALFVVVCAPGLTASSRTSARSSNKASCTARLRAAREGSGLGYARNRLAGHGTKHGRSAAGGRTTAARKGFSRPRGSGGARACGGAAMKCCSTASLELPALELPALQSMWSHTGLWVQADGRAGAGAQQGEQG